MGDQTSSPSQIIALPKGGGALHGLGEKFSPDLHTGTGNFTVPIAIPPGRNGFQPQLSLVYSTGNGNGLFGLGWNLSIPGVTRKTSKGIPRYRDYDGDLAKRDVFILSGAEDLVLVSDDSLDPLNATRYRPRTEGLFAKIIHRHDPAASADFWEVSSKDGLVSFYGVNPADQQNYDPTFQPQTTPATIVKPKSDSKDIDRIFAWKLTLTKDPFGNRIEYLYQRRDQSTAQDGGDGHEWDQPLLTQIRYVDFQENGKTKFLVTVTFDYEDREDPFSDYRAGFEIRTSQRCKSILVETRTDKIRPVREYQFAYEYDRYNGVSLLKQIEVIGFDDEGNCYDGRVHGGQVRERQLPPLEFSYTQFDPEKRKFELITGADLPPLSVGHPDMELVDLHGAGLPDILEMNGTVRYWRNRGNGRFDIPQPMREAPADMELATAGVQLLDADGDGRTDLMVSSPPLAGYFPSEFPAKWSSRSFQKYRDAPSFNLEDPEVRLVDLTGDGVTDVLRSGTRMECFFNDPKLGWSSKNVNWVERKALEEFPNVNFSDPRVKLADMTGDGMQDIVLVHDGSVEYWPNLGYGNWGKRIHMKNSPQFPYGYDPKRVLIGDVDGDGLADIAYVDHREVSLWINRSGNGWNGPVTIEGTPPVTDVDGLRLVDLLGSGIAGVLWSTNVGKLGPRNFMFLDFTGGIKPYLLGEMNNHLGATTTVEYKPSTHFYLQDERKASTRWRTPLPFPVQVVAKVEVIDDISKGRLTTEYRYHHGYWDGAEREFRGFGMVEQLDSELFIQYEQLPTAGDEFEAVSEVHFSPPTLTKTWFHLGPVGPEYGDWKTDLDWSNEFWAGDPPLLDHNEFVTPFLRALGRDDSDSRRIRRNAVRALRGSVIRTELYALDGSPNQDRPYTVTESEYDLDEIDYEKNSTRQRIFFPHLRGQRTTQWERGNDPLTVFAFTENYDDFGHPRRSTSIACPRGWRSMEDRPAADYLATRTVTRHALPGPNGPYIYDRVAVTTAFGLTNTPGQTVRALRDAPDTAGSLRVIGQTVNYYDGAEFVGLAGAAFGKIGNYGALTRTEQLVFTDQHLTDALSNTGGGVPPWLNRQNPAWAAEYPASFRASVPTLGGYIYRDGTDGFHATGYFANTTRKVYDFQRGSGSRGMARAQRDPLGHETTIDYDPFDLLPLKVRDPVGLEVSGTYNYRLLQPRQVTDSNGNTTTAEYNPIGLLAKTWVRGKQANEGDSQRPSVKLSYDFLAFERGVGPISVRTLRYERHDPNDADATIETREYSDGFGRLLQTRTQAEDIIYGDAVFGADILPADLTIRPGLIQGKRRAADGPPNVVVSGWQVYDNKGRVVEKYEPFFDRGWEYALPRDSQLGKKVTMFYDPRGQVIRTANPDASEQRVIYGVPKQLDDPPQAARDTDKFLPSPWEAYTYDANDNAGRTHSVAGQDYRHHWNTPSSIVINALGRTVEAVQRNCNAPGAAIEEHRIRSIYDIRGNIIAVTDALGRSAFQHVFDLANHRWRLDSIDAGLRVVFSDAAGNLIETRDSKGAITLRAYDSANRLTHLWARDTTNEQVTLREQLNYGDQLADQVDARKRNLRGKPYQHRDEAGQLTFELYDFKGNLLEKVRKIIDPIQLANAAFRVDWEAGNTPQLNWSSYGISTTYDALNRITTVQYPLDVDGERKKLTHLYNRAGALESVMLNSDIFVSRIAYNAKRQRTLIAYGNNILTVHEYDKDTFRLRRTWTSAATQTGGNKGTYQPNGLPLQNLRYSYDLAGNVTEIVEMVPGCGVRNNVQAAQHPNLGFALAAGDALVREFGYDALYRLISATGREADNIQSPLPWPDNFHSEGFNWGTPAVPNPGNARDHTRIYVESYAYDPAGNMMKLRHNSGGAQWTRNFGMSGFTPAQWRRKVQNFITGALPDWGAGGNQLTGFGTDMQGITHRFDANGNTTQEFASRIFEWDHSDRLRSFRQLDGAGNDTKSARYLYDSAGERVLKYVRVAATVKVTAYVDGLFEHYILGAAENNTLQVTDDKGRIALVRVGSPLDGDAAPFVQYQLRDHLAGAAITIGGDDATQAGFRNREEYYPYGETTFGSYQKKRYRFAGKERDEESGLSYFGARYYAQHLCRWTSCDRNTKSGINLFVYVANSPVTLLDPNGRFAVGSFLQLAPDAAEVGGGAAEAATAGAAAGGVPSGGGLLAAVAAPAVVILAGVLAIGTVILIFDEADRLRDAQDRSIRRFAEGQKRFETELKAAVAEGRVTANQARLFRLGYVPSENELKFIGTIDRITASLAPEHHIATDKNTKQGDRWTTILEQLFEVCGVSMQEMSNKVRLPGHKGPHPSEYHAAVLIRLLLDTLTVADAKLMDKIGLNALLQMKLREALKDPKMREKCAENLRKALEDIKQQLLEDPDLVHSGYYDDLEVSGEKQSMKKPKAPSLNSTK
jgi:RHS repeat-associated protein